MYCHFVPLHVHVLVFFLPLICFLSPLDFFPFYRRVLVVNVRNLTFVIMYKCPRVLGVMGSEEYHVAFGQ